MVEGLILSHRTSATEQEKAGEKSGGEEGRDHDEADAHARQGEHPGGPTNWLPKSATASPPPTLNGTGPEPPVLSRS
ncbi:hypothetical protein ACWGKA_20360 [Streptomyces luteogriseus]